MMLEYMLETYSFLPLPDHTLKIDMEKYLGEQLAWCEDDEFSSHFPYKETGLKKSFFRQKVITCDGNEYLTGPRYLDGNIKKPFIELVASSAPLTKRAAQLIYSVWQPMQANAIRLLRQCGSDMSGCVDQYIYAGNKTGLEAFQEYDDSGVFLQQATPSIINWCVQAVQSSYDDTYLKIPNMKNYIRPCDKEEIHESVKESQVFIIYHGTSPAGFIICKCERSGFISGYWITEEAILPEFKGSRLASIAQRILYSALPEKHTPVSLWGTIVNGNTPSIRSAERAGRKRVMEYVFLKEGDI